MEGWWCISSGYGRTALRMSVTSLEYSFPSDMYSRFSVFAMSVSLKSVWGDGCVEGEHWPLEADYCECRTSVQFYQYFILYLSQIVECFDIIVYFTVFTVMQWYLILQEHVTPVGLCKLLISS
jgi:hypothetical protein